jgi:hypothetical protein
MYIPGSFCNFSVVLVTSCFSTYFLHTSVSEFTVNHCGSHYLPPKGKNRVEKVKGLRNFASPKWLGRWCQCEPTAAWTGKELRTVFLLWKPIPVEPLRFLRPNVFTAWNE